MRSMRKLGICGFLFVSLFAIVACDSSEGESCSDEGRVDGECEEGLVCGKKSGRSSDLACLKQCQTSGDCPSGQQCNGVGGTSLKGCRPDL